MSDIQKIQLIHDLKSTFTVDEHQLEKLINQIEDNEKKENIDRFFKGYTTEDAFLYLGSALPWIRCIHALDQDQQPKSSKSEFQVPDYTVVFENFERACFPIFIDVKRVKSQKRSLEVMCNQVDQCTSYADIFSAPFAYAIYWETWRIWTINTKDQFKIKNKKIAISVEDAIKNDLSAIFGNVNYYIPKISRTTICIPKAQNVSDDSIIHEKYGVVIADSISQDGVNFIPLAPTDSFILDSFADMEIVSVISENNQTVLKEQSKSIYFLNLASLIYLCLASLSDNVSKDNHRAVMVIIIDFMQKFNFTSSHKIPSKHSDMALSLYETAFSGTSILEDYKSTYGV